MDIDSSRISFILTIKGIVYFVYNPPFSVRLKVNYTIEKQQCDIIYTNNAIKQYNAYNKTMQLEPPKKIPHIRSISLLPL